MLWSLKPSTLHTMRQPVVTNDPVLLSSIQALLSGAGVHAVVLDQHLSMAEGSIGALPRRLMVAETFFVSAANVLNDADLGQYIYDNL
ncbi:MAG: DUF2007 domain-containing protein [Hyphomicrobium sp.]